MEEGKIAQGYSKLFLILFHRHPICTWFLKNTLTYILNNETKRKITKKKWSPEGPCEVEDLRAELGGLCGVLRLH